MPPKLQPATAQTGQPSQPHQGTAAEHFHAHVFTIDDIDEFHGQHAAPASAVFQPAVADKPLGAPGVAFALAQDFPRDMFILDRKDIDDIDEVGDLAASARPPVLAPIAGTNCHRPGSLAALAEFQMEFQASPRYFPDQPAGYIFDGEVTDYTRQLWHVLPKDLFWLIMGSVPSAEILSD